jgi:hypothetical protein
MRTRRLIVLPCVFGLIGISTIASNPRFEAFHTVDVLQLITSGMCFGIARMALMGRLKSRTKE